MLDSIVFVPSDQTARPWLIICAEHCARHGYHMVAVVSDWDDAWHMLRDGEAQVLVIGQRDHLPPDRLPRIEFVTDVPPDVPPELRRPRRM